ncbi:5-deoxy-glucuronate isomerase [Streptomyces sp. NPDC097619]|uniref:5-deoxy-glucuronate isomerase n=1 Tax=Streptomyces sp. NPDC097619 TaxID=3157228 RepID=UPI0033201CD4
MPLTAEHVLDRTRLRILDLAPGEDHTIEAGDHEWILLPLSGGCEADCLPAGAPEPVPFRLHGRPGVFRAVTDFAYLPRDSRTRIRSATGGRYALAGARCERVLPPRYGPAAGVPVELRGSGTCSRQVNNFAAADVFDCDRLIAVEVLTPGGNWSSYPPHKHDEEHPGEETALTEIYYYEIAPHGDHPGLGYQRVSPSPAGKTDLLAEVRTGDAVLIPDGWHGPSIAAPGHDMYYLNVMAGDGPDRAWLIRDHPGHAWIRQTWPDRPVDPRLPFYRAPATTGPAGAEPAAGRAGTEPATHRTVHPDRTVHPTRPEDADR